MHRKEKIEKMFSIAEDFPKIEDVLIKRYFRNMDAYFSYGALEEGLLGEQVKNCQVWTDWEKNETSRWLYADA